METATTEPKPKKPGRPKGSKNRGTTAKKEYRLFDADKFDELELGTAMGTSSKDSLRDAFSQGLIGEESNVVAIPDRYVNRHKATANQRITIRVEDTE